MTEQQQTPHQKDTEAVIDELTGAMAELWPDVAPQKLNRFGAAVASMFEQVWQAQVRNMLPFAAQGERTRAEVQALRGQVVDQRTVVGDLLMGRVEIEQRLTTLEAQTQRHEQRLRTVEARHQGRAPFESEQGE